MNQNTRGCLKNGCFGCLGLIVMGVLAFIILAAIQMTAGEAEYEPVSVTRHQPLSDTATQDEDPASRQLEADLVASDQPQVGKVLPLPEPLIAVEPRPGRLVLDLGYGEFRLQRGAPGEELKVEADYDGGSYELKEQFTEDDEGWSYKVSFDRKGGALSLLFGGAKKVDNRVVITIPQDHPIDIVGEVGIGELEADLGGLWIPTLDLEFSAGEHKLTFDEPTRQPMEQFSIQGSVGEIAVASLGNASPREVRFEQNIGEARLDLTGAWLNDSTVRAELSIGDMRLKLPDDVRITMSKPQVGIGEVRASRFDRSDLPEDAPTLTIDASASIGEIRVD